MWWFSFIVSFIFRSFSCGLYEIDILSLNLWVVLMHLMTDCIMRIRASAFSWNDGKMICLRTVGHWRFLLYNIILCVWLFFILITLSIWCMSWISYIILSLCCLYLGQTMMKWWIVSGIYCLLHSECSHSTDWFRFCITSHSCKFNGSWLVYINIRMVLS